MKRTLCVCISVPEKYQARARYVFQVLSNAWGLPVDLDYDAKPGGQRDIFYGLSLELGATSQTLFIPFDAMSYSKAAVFREARAGRYSIWSRCGVIGETDFIGSVYRLLTLLDESQVSEQARNSLGVFSCEALPFERQRTTREPLVENIADFLLDCLLRLHPDYAGLQIPRWPSGRKWALAVTHDTDSVHLGAIGELAANLVKGISARSKEHLAMFRNGLRFIGRPNENPLFGFPIWRTIESSIDVRSCFYLSGHQHHAVPHTHDSKSTVFRKGVDWTIIQAMNRDGWEFGVHAPIRAKDSLDAFCLGKQRLEERLEAPILGIRHHYWALNWGKPYLTFRKHMNAGFRYDTSLAWQDRPGFRSGTCLPYQPFDLGWQKALPIYELPCCLMDGTVIRGNKQSRPIGISAAIATLDTVRRSGGVAVIDWHTESANGAHVFRDYPDVLRSILDVALGSADVWVATPWEIVKWWHDRTRRLTGRLK
jgi:hypothetical protein